MNKQIQKLAQRANKDLDGAIPIGFAEKFSELIVRECAQIADDGYGSDHFGNGIAGYQLLKHFGVAE